MCDRRGDSKVTIIARSTQGTSHDPAIAIATLDIPWEQVE